MRTFHVHTPLLHSVRMSRALGCTVYAKMDCMQPSGSFKDRGMGVLISRLVDEGKKRFISSSGGNAGHAAAYVCNRLGVPISVIVPETTTKLMITKISEQGANVEVYGKNWNEADQRARYYLESDPEMAYIHPYGHPWYKFVVHRYFLTFEVSWEA